MQTQDKIASVNLENLVSFWTEVLTLLKVPI